MPSVREIVAGYEAVNAWEQEEKRRQLPTLTIEESIRHYLDMWDLVRSISPEAEDLFLEQRLAHYRTLHRRMTKAAQVMGRVDQD
jgi:hypothetical protein